MILDLSSVLSEPHRPIDTSVPVEMDVFQSAQGSFPLKEKSELHLLIEYEKERKLQISGKAEQFGCGTTGPQRTVSRVADESSVQ